MKQTTMTSPLHMTSMEDARSATADVCSLLASADVIYDYFRAMTSARDEVPMLVDGVSLSELGLA